MGRFVHGSTGKFMNSTETLADGAMTLQKASEFSGIGRTKLFQLIREGTLPVLKVGRRTLVPRKALVELLAGFVKDDAG